MPQRVLYFCGTVKEFKRWLGFLLIHASYKHKA